MINATEIVLLFMILLSAILFALDKNQQQDNQQKNEDE